MNSPPVLVWIRRDLRLTDNPALYYAAQYDAPVLPVFIWAPEEEAPWAMGGAQKWWLHYSLQSFQETLRAQRIPLIIRQGPSLQTLLDIVRETGATVVHWNEAFEPAEKHRDQNVLQDLNASGIKVQQFDSHLLHDPEAIRTGKGDPYKVYTPFWRNIKSNLKVPLPLGTPECSAVHQGPTSLHIEDLNLLPSIDWASGIRATWKPGESTAMNRLSLFVDSTLSAYATNRDLPRIDGTSKLSPHIHFGEISPRMIWHHIMNQDQTKYDHTWAEPFLKQLIWREFSYHLLYHFPETATNNLRPSFDRFPWSNDPSNLKKWQRGETGYPIVDAGMRQLWETGWMHNRVRMIVASFLTKHLLIHWLEGARWFWDTLVDANLANNTMGWQWSAGSGADAQPFFRIFNPIAQSKKFDPHGDYIKQWIPALRSVPSATIHEPWLLTPIEQKLASLELGTYYPFPIVDHKSARERALDAYRSVSK